MPDLVAFPISTVALSDVPSVEVPTPGVKTTDVSKLATSGAGTYASPFLGWDTALAALLVSQGANQAFVFPSGTYGYASTVEWGAYSNVHFKGEMGTVLKYTGSGVAVSLLAVLATSVTNPTQAGTHGIVMENFIIDGTGTGTTGLFSSGIHYSNFKNVWVRDVTDKGIHLAFAICNVYDNCHVSPNVGDSDGIGQATVSPDYGLWTTTGAVVDGGAFQTNQACTFINFVAEGCNLWGCYLGAFHQNTFIGGTNEFNGGNVQVFGNGNTWICTDNEYPQSSERYDWLIVGDDNQLINCLATHRLVVGKATENVLTVRTIITGGQYDSIEIDPSAQRTAIDGPAYNFLSGGGFYDGSYSTEYRSPSRNLAGTNVKGWGIKTPNDALFRGITLFSDVNNGPTLTAPNGGLWRLTVDNAGALTTTAGTAPSFHAQSDAFTDNSIGDQWVKGTHLSSDIASTLVTVAETGSQLSITLPNTTGGNHFNGIKSVGRILNDTGYERINLISKPTTGLTSYHVRFSMGWGLGTTDLQFVLENTTLYAYDAGASVASVTFVLANMDFWRFLRDGADIKFQYSADGSSWTNFYTASPPFGWNLGAGVASDPYTVCIEAGSTGSATFDAPVIFDNYLYNKG